VCVSVCVCVCVCVGCVCVCVCVNIDDVDGACEGVRVWMRVCEGVCR
jgi:hypothetical protein